MFELNSTAFNKQKQKGNKMKSSSFAVVFFLLTAVSFYPQNKMSLQFTGGIISPIDSYGGLTGLIQLNYPVTKNINFYFYSGYSAWDRNIVTFFAEWSLTQKQTRFYSYSADNHILIPIFFGSSINFNTNKIFTAFVNFEIGYSYLKYNWYKNIKSVDPSTGVVLSYFPDISTRQEITENLIGTGIGAGIFHPLTENVNLILSFKLNSYLNSKYYGFLGSGITWSTYLAGFNVKI